MIEGVIDLNFIPHFLGKLYILSAFVKFPPHFFDKLLHSDRFLDVLLLELCRQAHWQAWLVYAIIK